MPEASRETVEVTAVLRNILDSYPAGSAVIREILQNTDDSSATTQTFILDTRTSHKGALVDPTLASCQGPAIIAVNNGYFEEKDWLSITRVHISSKTGDEASTGKYGLGFRSSYHVTDNPQILSGDTLLILDPHQRVRRFPGGFRLSTMGADRQTYRGHFEPFDAVLPPLATRYEGTAIRLPLRLDASQSSIKSTATDVDSARQMFKEFIANDLGECMLFLKHITEVELIEIDPRGNEIPLGRSWISNPSVVRSPRSRERGQQVGIVHSGLTINVEVGGRASSSQWIITQSVEEYGVAQGHLETRLGRSSLASEMAVEKLLPHVSLAFPVLKRGTNTWQTNGRLFTLLPLPIYTGFPLHINAVLALTSSRRNLRNPTDAVKGSREDFLVEWNKVIFSELVPKAWAAMFNHFVTLHRGVNYFQAWPQFSTSKEGDRIYWQALPIRLLQEVGHVALWPVQASPTQSVPTYHRLSDILVASESSDDPITALQTCGVPIITPPTSLYELIEQSELYRSRILTPATVHGFLKRNTASLLALEADSAQAITDYLVTGEGITFLYGLPLFLNCKGSYTTMVPGTTYTYATDEEASLFEDADPGLLKLDIASPTIRALQQYTHYDQLHPIRAIDVVGYLSQLFGQFRSETATISATTEMITWLTRFWNWVGDAGPTSSLFSRNVAEPLSKLFVMPLDGPETLPKLCRFSRGVMEGSALDSDLRDALRALGVPVLHLGVSISEKNKEILTKQPPIIFILENITRQTSFDHLDQNSRQILHSYLTDQLSTFHRSEQKLSPQHQTIIRNIPVFPVLSSGSRSTSSEGLVQIFGVASNSPVFVDETVQVIPSISGKPFYDGKEGAVLAQALAQNVLGEMDVLRLVLEPINWEQQGNVEKLEELLVGRLVSRLNDFDNVGRARVADLPIVAVGANRAPVKPSSVVDPHSEIACLFDPKDGVLPYGRFWKAGPGTLLQQFCSFRILRSTLDDSIIIELLTRLSNPSTPFPSKEQKVLSFLPLLEKYAKSSKISSKVQRALQSQKWLPVNKKMHRPSECWDSRSNDSNLCDFVLPLLQTEVRSLNLREALGWKAVPPSILREQIVAVVSGNPPLHPLTSQNTDFERIVAVIREILKQFRSKVVSSADLTDIADALGELPWVPVGPDSCRPPQQTMLATDEIGTRFQSVYSSLTKLGGMAEMLKGMGLCDRPNPSALLKDLENIAAELAQEKSAGSTEYLTSDFVAILREIGRRPLEFNMERVPVLDDMRVVRLIGSVVFNDRGPGGGEPPAGSYFAHRLISRSVAMALGMRLFSEEELDRDEGNIVSFCMADELPARVNSALKGFDSQNAFNEWVAGADAVNASTIEFALHEGTPTGSRLLSPDMMQFQNVASLVIRHDGVLTDGDFEGIRSIGVSGRDDTPGATGRSGPSAFSFYHFTDVLMIVSAESVWFLDPSGSHLPRTKEGKSRMGLKMSLSLCRSRFPDQLRPLEEIFDLEGSIDKFDGTLFWLPLRSASQANRSQLSSKSFTIVDAVKILRSYFQASTQSMFFSKLRSISAKQRVPNAVLPLWSVTGSHHPYGVENDGFRVEVEIKDPTNVRWKEEWLVCTSSPAEVDFPATLQPLFRQHRLQSPKIGIALHMRSEGNPSNDLNFCLFTTLPLTVSTSLPAHIHAAWILSESSRALRLDLIDKKGRRPFEAQYNEHILQSLVPPLYLRALAIMSSRNPGETDLSWPTKGKERINQVVSSAVYARLKDTGERVLRTVSDELIAPKDALIAVTGPPAVGRVLAGLHLQELTHRVPFEWSLVEHRDTLRTDTAKEVASLLRNNTKDVRRFYESDPTKAADINTVLRYILEAKIPVDLTGVPLLQVGDGQIKSFKSPSEQKVFCTSCSDVGALFGLDKIIGLAIPQEVAAKLCGLNLNVRKLDVGGMRELLQHCAAHVVPREETEIAVELRPWYSQLLTFLTNPTSPVKLEQLADLPLIPITHGGLAISLNRARRRDVWWTSHDDHAITPVLQQYNVHVVEFPGSLAFRTHDVDLAGILSVLGSAMIHVRLSQHGVVASHEWTMFAEWMQQRLTFHQIQRLGGAHLEILRHLPLFVGQRGQAPAGFTSAANITMLPPSITANDVARYLPNHLILTSFSYPLQATLAAVGSDQSLSTDAVISKLTLPDVLPPGDEVALKSIIVMVSHHGQGMYELPLIPDENWNLRVPSTLYDGDVQVFRALFQNRSEKFVRPSFRNIMDQMGLLGVHRTVTPDDIVGCARSIDQDSRTDGMDTRSRAEYLWHFLNQDFDDVRRLDLSAIANLRFVPAHLERHPTEPRFSHYGSPLPDVVSLNELCLAQHAHTVWTQRATFDEAPSPVIRSIYRDIGVPTIQELVAHLVVLTTRVVTEHPGSRILLPDLRHTYNAIQRQATVARPFLLQHRDQRLWLNVDDPATENWAWRSAGELVFDLRYDNDRYFDVKSLLHPYKGMLLSLGAQEYHYAKLNASENWSHADEVVAGWRALRRDGELFDIQFVVDGAGDPVKAHRGLLAAVVPYFKVALTAGFRESQAMTDGIDVDDGLPDHPVPPGTCAFAVRSAVDFVYNGKFSPPSSETTEEAGEALGGLLDLLELANYWLLERLKAQAIETMVALQLVRAETSDGILERVRSLDVPQLVEICQKNKANNMWI